MKVEDAVAILQRLGLSPEEAVVYAHLHAIGTTTAGAVAAACKLSRPQTYRALESLAARGVIQSDLSRPRRFAALPVSHLIKYLKAEAESQASEVRELEPELTRSLAANVAPKMAPDQVRYDVLRGRQAVLTFLHELYGRARKEILLFLSHPAGLSLIHQGTGLDPLTARAQAGVHVRIVLRSRPENENLLEVASSTPNLWVRVADTEIIGAGVVVDGREALTVLVADAKVYPRSDATMALVTNAPNYVATQALLFQKLWETAREVRGYADGDPITRPKPGGAARSKAL